MYNLNKSGISNYVYLYTNKDKTFFSLTEATYGG